MRYIIDPVPKEKLKKELTEDKLLRKTNFGNNEIYVITAHDSPNVMLEIGRLREIAFRNAGGGTGKSYDIDRFDKCEIPYKQLVLWNPEKEEIIGGYRFLKLIDIYEKKGSIDTAFTELFKLSKKFIDEYLPYTIELGRSYIAPSYQSLRYSRKSIYSLDNLWDGLGTLIIHYPEMKYFFGKVTMYTHFNQEARDYILGFMKIYFRDKENLVYPRSPVKISFTDHQLKEIFSEGSFEEDYKILSKKVRELDENIPPLINAYMGLSPSMRTFGTAINDRFGGVEETGIIITIKDLYSQKVGRHVSSYKKKE